MGFGPFFNIQKEILYHTLCKTQVASCYQNKVKPIGTSVC